MNEVPLKDLLINGVSFQCQKKIWACLKFATGPREKDNFYYCGVLATSPTLAGPLPLKLSVAESASISVTVPSPTLLLTVLITFPVVGSLIWRSGRLISNLSPTLNPVLLPTLMISVFPLTSATMPATSTFLVGTLAAELSSFAPTSPTAWVTASPRSVWPKFEACVSKPPPPPPPLPAPRPTRDVPERFDSPSPVTAARISPVVVSTTRALIAHTAFDSFFLMPPMPNPARPKPTPPRDLL